MRKEAGEERSRGGEKLGRREAGEERSRGGKKPGRER